MKERCQLFVRMLRALSPLPDTAGEIRSVAQALGGDASSVLLGAAASEGALRAHESWQAERVAYNDCSDR